MAGLTGIGLLCAAVLGAPLAWTGPLAYLVLGLYVFAAGLAAITLRGARDRPGGDGPG